MLLRPDATVLLNVTWDSDSGTEALHVTAVNSTSRPLSVVFSMLSTACPSSYFAPTIKTFGVGGCCVFRKCRVPRAASDCRMLLPRLPDVTGSFDQIWKVRK